jgi:hypothetical protein
LSPWYSWNIAESGIKTPKNQSINQSIFPYFLFLYKFPLIKNISIEKFLYYKMFKKICWNFVLDISTLEIHPMLLFIIEFLKCMNNHY